MIFQTPFFFRWLYPGLVWRIPTQEKKIYLTFDDGPVPGPTEFVLDELRRTNAQATFFCIGSNVVKNESVFRRIQVENHSVGNHTYNHVNGWGCGYKKYLDDVEQCEKTIGKTSLFRPPYGRATRRQLRALAAYEIIMWDVLSYDYSKNVSPEKCLRGVLGAVRPGSIVVFHDSYKAEKNLTYVLPRVLDHLSGQGYLFESLRSA